MRNRRPAFTLLALTLAATISTPAIAERPLAKPMRAEGGCAMLEFPYDGDLHAIPIQTGGRPLTVTSAESNVAPVTVFSPEVGEGFFEQYGLAVWPGFTGTIHWDFVTRYFIHLPWIRDARAALCVRVGDPPPTPDPPMGMLKKDVETTLYSGNGKKKSVKITVSSDSDCPVTVSSDSDAIGTFDIQPGFSGTAEDANPKCEAFVIEAYCAGEEGAGCTFGTS